jgi:hypothetical protein
MSPMPDGQSSDFEILRGVRDGSFFNIGDPLFSDDDV